MGTILVLAVVATAVILPFLDQIIANMFPKGALSAAEDECHQALDDEDCFKIPSQQ